jgi:VanZ family protein
LWAPVALYMAGIFYLSAQSNPPTPGGIPDKVLHAIEYFGFGAVVFRAVAGGLPALVDARRARRTLLIAVGYAASDELHQLFVPYRTADVRDLLADAVGVALALIACWAWHIIQNPKSQIPSPKSQVQNPKSQVQNPKSQVQNPKSQVQNPKSLH